MTEHETQLTRPFVAVNPAAETTNLMFSVDHTESRGREKALRIELDRMRRRETQLLDENDRLRLAKRQMVARCADLRRRTRDLKRADAMKMQLLLNISHEMRNPLQSIFGLTSLLLYHSVRRLDPEQEKSVTSIQKAADLLLGMFEEVVDFFRPEEKIEARLREINVGAMFDDLRATLPAALLNAEVRLVFEAPSDLPRLYSDQKKICQILRNLINNALKFTEHGEIRVRAVGGHPDEIVLTVSDTGSGIAATDLDRIFDDFVQLPHPLQANARGFGLGLPLCRKLAAALGGRIDVISELGRGSEFALILPCQTSTSAE
jgi:signal transduction histidine kinase